MYICMYIYMCVCMCIHIYIYIYIYIFIQVYRDLRPFGMGVLEVRLTRTPRRPLNSLCFDSGLRVEAEL